MLLENQLPHNAIALLQHSYKFVNQEWQHIPRDSSPDQGFEPKFRESCITKMSGWVVSQHREMNLGSGFDTASSVLHEIDVVVQQSNGLNNILGIFELKNRYAQPPEKNDVIVFFAKILDYLCLSPSLILSKMVPIFLSSYPFAKSGLAACLGLGIYPVGPSLRPLPILIDNAMRMKSELDRGVVLSTRNKELFDEFFDELSYMYSLLAEADLNTRFDFVNDETLSIHASGVVTATSLAEKLLMLNGECTHLLELFRVAKRG
jgi:hypothetical protein